MHLFYEHYIKLSIITLYKLPWQVMEFRVPVTEDPIDSYEGMVLRKIFRKVDGGMVGRCIEP